MYSKHSLTKLKKFFLPLINQPITIIGLPGAGKTTLVKALSAELNIKPFDSDILLSHIYKKNISYIIEQINIDNFRIIEAFIIFQTFKKNKELLLSTGGGSITCEKLFSFLLNNSNVVWLDDDLHNIHKRILKDTNSRFYFKNSRDSFQELCKTNEDRKELYTQAHYRLDARTFELS